ncbi:MAG: AraC family transcriptional regulator [Xanthomonadales bacterium]|nr:AraC family transcriptional regulator [Xanthomonadales bacterium]
MSVKAESRTSPEDMFVSKQPIDFSGSTEFFDDQVKAEALALARNATHKTFPALGESRYSHARVFNAHRYSIRTYVPEEEGSGYWDLFRLSEKMVVMVGDCSYQKPKWLGVPDEGYFKIRLLWSGSLRAADGKSLLASPGAMLALYPRGTNSGYFVAEGVPCKVVILHCAISMLSEELGIDMDPKTANMPFSLLARGDSADPHLQELDLTPRLVNAMSDILDSRDLYTANLRDWFVEARAKEILAAVMQSLVQEPELAVAANRITRRDRHRILEAQEIVKASLSDLPTISSLSRMIGMNQTKLKAGFKEIVGCTIGEFIKQQQMESAARLLQSTELAISEISYAVGYGHPANFSQAFKHFYGCLPKSVRNRAHLGAHAKRS